MIKTKKIAITGIDGSGKSTITKKLIEKNPLPAERIPTISCPLFHETPNAPLSNLSRQLDAFSKISDKLENIELKGIAQFIQTTLFGYVEQFFINTYKPKLIINERHPIIDSIAYGNLYFQLMQKSIDRNLLEEPLVKLLEQFQPGTYSSINKWVSLIASRLNQNFTLWDIDKFIYEIFSYQGKDLIIQLEKLNQTNLPDVIIILDVKPELASSRISNREKKHVELHEKPSMLEQIRQEYHKAIQTINKEYTQIETHIIYSNDVTSIESTLNNVIKNIF